MEKYTNEDGWSDFLANQNESNRPRGQPDYEKMKYVYHVTHIDSAASVIEKRGIRAGLVYDESRLNTERTLVTWLSPNQWKDGYRYGNVAFCYDFEREIAKGMNYYWVGVADYKPAAARILITDQDHDSYLSHYDPRKSTGPWRIQEDGSHQRDCRITLEFMLESSLDVDKASIEFVKHHPSFCTNDAPNCPDRGRKPSNAAAIWLAIIAGRENQLTQWALQIKDHDKIRANENIFGAWEIIAAEVQKVVFKGEIAIEQRPAVARAIFAAYGRQNLDDFASLCSLYPNPDLCKKDLVEILEHVTNLSSASLAQQLNWI